MPGSTADSAPTTSLRACGEPPPHGRAGWRGADAFSEPASDAFARRVVVTEPWRAARPKADAMVTRTEASRSASRPPTARRYCSSIRARVIGAAHAGWKGALTGVLESTLDAMETLGAHRDDVVVALGPMIRQRNYEVGMEFVARFEEADADNALFFASGLAQRPRDVRSRRLHPQPAEKCRRVDDRGPRLRHLCG